MPAWMMSSEISTDTAGTSFRAWHLFVLVGLVAATVAVITVQPTDTAALVFSYSQLAPARMLVSAFIARCFR